MKSNTPPILMKRFLIAALAVISANAQAQLANKYPGDRGIETDPAVILADNFETYTNPSQMTAIRWNKVSLRHTRIATEAGNVFSGHRSLEFALPISSTEVGISAMKNISPARDVVFIRAYTKFDPGFIVKGSHNGLKLSANDPGTPTKPPANGTGFFLFNLQNSQQKGEVPPGFSHLYVYWPKQRSKFGDHWFSDGTVLPNIPVLGGRGEWLAYPNQYPDFQVMPNHLPQRGRWYCYELMVKANTVGQKNGEVKFWIDGKLTARFPNLFLRSISTLKVDQAFITLHAGHSERVNKKWYDNVVIATQYIGPMRP
jgi:hypothetical protein